MDPARRRHMHIAAVAVHFVQALSGVRGAALRVLFQGSRRLFENAFPSRVPLLPQAESTSAPAAQSPPFATTLGSICIPRIELIVPHSALSCAASGAVLTHLHVHRYCVHQEGGDGGEVLDKEVVCHLQLRSMESGYRTWQRSCLPSTAVDHVSAEAGNKWSQGCIYAGPCMHTHKALQTFDLCKHTALQQTQVRINADPRPAQTYSIAADTGAHQCIPLTCANTEPCTGAHKSKPLTCANTQPCSRHRAAPLPGLCKRQSVAPRTWSQGCASAMVSRPGLCERYICHPQHGSTEAWKHVEPGLHCAQDCVSTTLHCVSTCAAKGISLGAGPSAARPEESLG